MLDVRGCLHRRFRRGSQLRSNASNTSASQTMLSICAIPNRLLGNSFFRASANGLRPDMIGTRFSLESVSPSTTSSYSSSRCAHSSLVRGCGGQWLSGTGRLTRCRLATSLAYLTLGDLLKKEARDAVVLQLSDVMDASAVLNALFYKGVHGSTRLVVLCV